jgi:hypothetical protein
MTASVTLVMGKPAPSFRFLSHCRRLHRPHPAAHGSTAHEPIAYACAAGCASPGSACRARSLPGSDRAAQQRQTNTRAESRLLPRYGILRLRPLQRAPPIGPVLSCKLASVAASTDSPMRRKSRVGGHKCCNPGCAPSNRQACSSRSLIALRLSPIVVRENG